MLFWKIQRKVPDMAIRTTLIVGYPGETQEIFNELKDWVREQRFDRLGCFTYSHEENTGAYVLEDDVPQEVKEARVEEIMEFSLRFHGRKIRRKLVYKCIFDRKEGNYFIGRTEYDSPDVDNTVLVSAENTYISIGDFAEVKITSLKNLILYGELI
jgi:ribosomal protein S12 methylthiotransferase